MSEKVYALLLRLHSSGFRQAHGCEALQLFRDRARDETSLGARLRLWLDLLADLAISVPRSYRRAVPKPAVYSAAYPLDGQPSFLLLADESPRRGAIVSGAILSLVTLVGFPIWISHVDKPQPSRGSVYKLVRAAQANWSVVSLFAAQAPAGPSKRGSSLEAGWQSRILQAVIAHLNRHYPDPAVTSKMIHELRARERSGDHDSVTNGPALARLLTTQLRDVSQDKHLEVVYSHNPFPTQPILPQSEHMARYRLAMEQNNCTFEKVAILPGSIGYLKLNSFPDPAICRGIAASAMASLNAASTVIFDLRDNRGGDPSMVMFLAGYLFDHPQHLYNPRENTTRLSWTRSPVPGDSLADKPAYLLTSARTASAAEQFSFNLKMVKRATVVGETTRGSAHAGVFYRIDDHFGIGIRQAKPINPYSDHDWEGTGVDPDIKVSEASALERARKLAEDASRK